MFDLNEYLQNLIAKLQHVFADRLMYVGLQGSYLRGEATAQSDIDIMLVLDSLTLEDLDQYRAILQALGNYDKSCGFVCSNEDLKHWNSLELCHLRHTTKDVYGRLIDLIPAYTPEDVRQYTKLSLNNLYHELCHRYIHRGIDRSLSALPQVYKSVFFILQSLYYLRSGLYIQTKSELLQLLSGPDAQVLRTAMTIQQGTPEALAFLFDWCRTSLASL